MPEDSEEEDYSDRTISEDESDEDTFLKFAREDLQQCALLTGLNLPTVPYPCICTISPGVDEKEQDEETRRKSDCVT